MRKSKQLGEMRDGNAMTSSASPAPVSAQLVDWRKTGVRSRETGSGSE